MAKIAGQDISFFAAMIIFSSTLFFPEKKI
jgi:hypothetical protein